MLDVKNKVTSWLLPVSTHEELFHRPESTSKGHKSDPHVDEGRPGTQRENRGTVSDEAGPLPHRVRSPHVAVPLRA